MKSVGERIQNLREYRNMTIRALAAKLGISESQLSRIESGRTATVSSDILTGLAKAFDVSSDYILGLSPLEDNSHILSELRLSEAACEKLIRREVDGDTLSRWIEQENFGSLVTLSKAYFTDVYAEGAFYRNEVLNSAISFLRDHADETENPAAVRQKANDIAYSKTGPHEIELRQIETKFQKMLTDMKKQYEREQAEHDPARKRKVANQAFSAKLREIAEEVRALEGPDEERLDCLTERMVQEIQAKTDLPGWVPKLLKPVYKRIIRSAGNPLSAEPVDETVEAVDTPGGDQGQQKLHQLNRDI